MSGLLLTPVPHEEAMEFIKRKPVVSQRIFKALTPELKARAFAVAGVEAADTLQRLRERLADLPRGAQWEDIKKDLVSEISPFLVSSDEPDDRARQERGAVARAELLLRIHGFQSYSAAAHRELDEQRDIFTHWKYLSMEDSKVRHTHAALNGTILPHDSPFWRHHYPPWEWGCRCQVVGITAEEVEEIRTADRQRPPEDRHVMTGARLKALEEEGRLHRGPSKTYDVRSAVEKGDDSGFSWEPGSLRLDRDQIKDRYDPQTWAVWQTWAEQETIPELGVSVWEWMGGASPRSAIKPADVTAWLQGVGVSDVPGHVFTADEAARLVRALREEAPAQTTEMFDAVQGNAHFRAEKLHAVAQELLDLLPPSLVRSLPRIKIFMSNTMRSLGTYSSATRTIELNGISLVTDTEMRRSLWHEMIHWVHMEGPPSYRALLQDHFRARTNGFTEAVALLAKKTGLYYPAGTNGMPDDFADLLGDEYAGRIYGPPLESPSVPLGLEIPTCHLEKLSGSPALLASMLNHVSPKTGLRAWRETFLQCMAIFFHKP